MARPISRGRRGSGRGTHARTRRRPRRPGRRSRLRRALLLLAAGAIIWALCALPRWPELGERRPDLIVIHHSATPPRVGGRPIDAAAIDAMHACRGFRIVHGGRIYHIGYHYVILQDGTVQPGRPESARGAHARRENARSLGICLVGNYSRAENPSGRQGPTRPPAAQMRALVRLCADLERRYEIPVRNVVRHRDVGQTACPGDRFPMADLRAELRRELGPDEPEAARGRPWWRRLWRSARGNG